MSVHGGGWVCLVPRLFLGCRGCVQGGYGAWVTPAPPPTPSGSHHTYDRQAGGTHPIGMLSCFTEFSPLIIGITCMFADVNWSDMIRVLKVKIQNLYEVPLFRSYFSWGGRDISFTSVYFCFC